jgi:hypothetical protein
VSVKSAGRRGGLFLGGLVGGAVVVVERARRQRRAGAPTPGLRAFEDAPCFRAEHGASPERPPRQPSATA